MHLNLAYIIYDSLLQRNGQLLSENVAEHACWHYATLAHQALLKFDKGKALEDEPNLEVNLPAIAIATAKLYQLEHPGEFTLYLRLCKAQAQNIGLQWDHRVETPSLKVVSYEVN